MESPKSFFQQQLTFTELGFIWSFSRTQSQMITAVTDLPLLPLHFSDEILKTFLQLLPLRSIRRPKIFQFPLLKQVLETDRLWLPTLKRILPHTWKMKVENFDKAAKNDDAHINFCLWNLQILSLFPQLKEKPIINSDPFS